MGKHMAGRRSVAKQTFLQGALILTIGTAIVKVVGAVFKLPLANIITPNGMGFFTSAYNFYGVLFSLATAGFPVAIAKLVAENYSLGRYNDVRQVKRVAMPIFLFTGTIGTLIMLIGAKFYTDYVGNPGAYVPTLVLAPSIFFCCLAAIYRGYYEGLRNMYPTAVSEVLEALSKLVFGLSAAVATVYLCNQEYSSSGTVFGVQLSQNEAVLSTYSYAAAAAILGVTIGSMLSWLYLMLYYKAKGDGITREMYRSSPRPHSGRYMARKLISIAIPIAIGSIAMSAAGLIDSTMLLTRLRDAITAAPQVVGTMYQGLFPPENADPATWPNFLTGCYGNGLTIFMLVPAITAAFGVSALPSLTEAWTRRDPKEIKTSIESITRITCLFCIPAGLGITALAEPIANLLYGSDGDAQIIGRILLILGVSSIFSALGTPISAMLQAIGRPGLPVLFLFGGLLLKIGVNYTLCGIPEINVLGAGTGTLVCYFFVTMAEIIALIKITKVKISYRSTFIKPFICAAGCAAAAFGTSYLITSMGMSMKIACIAGMGVAVLVYVLLLLFSKTITKTDVNMLPKGEKIAKLLEKRGWIG